jgi:hypothetical protein
MSSLTASTIDVAVMDGGSSSPTTASPVVAIGSIYLPAAGGAGSTQLVIEQDVQFSAGTHILGVFFKQTAGTVATINLTASTSQTKDLSVFNPSFTGPMGATGATGPIGPPGGGSTIVSVRAYRVAAYTMPTTLTQFVFDTDTPANLSWDTQNAYNSSTGVFTAPVAGKYRVTCSYATNAGTAGVWLQAIIAKNGAQCTWGYSGPSGGAATYTTAQAIDTIDLAAGDTISTYIMASSAIGLLADARATFLTIDLLSGTGPAGPPGPTGPAAGPYNLVYYQTIPAPKVASNPYTVRHVLGTTFPLVQLWDATTLQQVMAQMTVVDANNVAIRVASDMPNPVNIVVMGVAGSPVPINPGDYATKSYVDARTPSLPSPITSGSGIQSFTDALGDVWVAANGVKGGNWYRARDVFHLAYYRVAGWNTSASSTPLAYDGQIDSSDPYGCYSGSTFTAPIPGMWRIDASAAANATASGQWIQVNISFAGGSQQGYGMAHSSLVIWMQANAWSVRRFSAGQTFVVNVASSVASLSGRVDIGNTKMSIDYLGTG